MQLRLARNKDGNQIINLIKRCFNDYKNCYLDVDNDSPELRNVYSYFKNKKGKFWVYVDKNKIIGCMGYLPHEKNNLEIHKLYIDKNYRMKGLAKKLMLRIESIAKKYKKRKIVLWTDTRFKEAHKMYKKLNYKKMSKKRRLNDISNTTEYAFQKVIN